MTGCYIEVYYPSYFRSYCTLSWIISAGIAEMFRQGYPRIKFISQLKAHIMLNERPVFNNRR